MIRCFLFALFITFTSLLFAIEPDPIQPRGYVAYHATKAPVIDGKLDDACWVNAPWSDDFVDIEGLKKPKPRQRTRMKITWDDQALYIAAELEETNIWAMIETHDAVIFQDPDFEVFIDPDGDGQLYGELELNAKNTTWDLLLPKPYRAGGRAINAWEIIGLKSAVAIDGTLNNPADVDQKWTVEIAWPWDGLKELAKVHFPPKDGEQWRINFSRVEWDVEVLEGKTVKVKNKPEHNWVWSPTGVIDMHRPGRWGYLQFSTKPQGPVAFQPDEDREVKEHLLNLFDLQHDFKEKHNRFAQSLEDLKWSGKIKPDFRMTQSGYEATLKHGERTWLIDQESRLSMKRR